MTPARFIFEATAENFPRLVLENSEKGPVLVNFWSPKAGPCMMLMPRLVRLADAYAGRFLLATLNTDQFGALARDRGVTSIPTTKVFRRGIVVDTLHGAESEQRLRQFIDRHVGAASEIPHVDALHAHAQGDIERAIRLAAEAAMANPDDPRIVRDLVKLLITQKRYDQAHSILAALPATLIAHADLATLQAHVELLQSAPSGTSIDTLQRQIADNPEDLAARFTLAAKAVVQNDYDTALNALLETVRRDRQFRNDIGRRAMLAIFEVLGEDDPRLRHYREALVQILH